MLVNEEGKIVKSKIGDFTFFELCIPINVLNPSIELEKVGFNSIRSDDADIGRVTAWDG